MSEGRGAGSRHVALGGPASHWSVELDGQASIAVVKLAVGGMDNNAYLLTDQSSGDTLLIDAAADPERILAELGDRRLVGIVTTHGHADHWQGLESVVAATKATTYLHPEDAFMVPWSADAPLYDDQRLEFGRASVRVLHTPGHTPGSVCVALEDAEVFTGDTLFPGGPGATRWPYSDFALLMLGLRERLFTLADDVAVHPGHGDATTIGAERPRLAQWQTRGW